MSIQESGQGLGSIAEYSPEEQSLTIALDQYFDNVLSIKMAEGSITESVLDGMFGLLEVVDDPEDYSVIDDENLIKLISRFNKDRAKRLIDKWVVKKLIDFLGGKDVYEGLLTIVSQSFYAMGRVVDGTPRIAKINTYDDHITRITTFLSEKGIKEVVKVRNVRALFLFLVKRDGKIHFIN